MLWFEIIRVPRKFDKNALSPSTIDLIHNENQLENEATNFIEDEPVKPQEKWIEREIIQKIDKRTQVDKKIYKPFFINNEEELIMIILIDIRIHFQESERSQMKQEM